MLMLSSRSPYCFWKPIIIWNDSTHTQAEYLLLVWRQTGHTQRCVSIVVLNLGRLALKMTTQYSLSYYMIFTELQVCARHCGTTTGFNNEHIVPTLTEHSMKRTTISHGLGTECVFQLCH